MAEGTFKRYEKKYLINETQYQQLLQRCRNKLAVDSYGEVTICNIYFDTGDHLLARNSLEKPVYKEKLRLRSYGVPEEGDMVYVEMKKKYKGIVYKRRVKMELGDARAYLYDGKPVDSSSQIIREINYFIQFYGGIAPAMYLSYNRIAMYGLEDPELRVTFDRDVLWREEELWLECGSWGSPMLEDGERLLEIKIPGAMPVWLSHVLDELRIYPASFSKYGEGYLQSRATEGKEIRKGDILYA